MLEPEERAGRLVRPYAMTRGRTRSAAMDLAIEALVQRTGRDALGVLPAEQAQLLARSNLPISVAELAAHTRLPLGVVRVLVGDLCGDGLLDVVSHGLVSGPIAGEDSTALPTPTARVAATDVNLLERVLHGLRAL